MQEKHSLAVLCPAYRLTALRLVAVAAGGALVYAAEAWCRERRYRLLTLHVFDANAPARRLYERAGFRVDTIKYLKEIG